MQQNISLNTQSNEVKLASAGTYYFEANGTSTKPLAMGMREMQLRAYKHRESRLLLIKAPPACGKSRALMYLALDKVIHQHVHKVIIAVPQMAIGASFKDTDLKNAGFFADWHVDVDLCRPGPESSKSARALQFLSNADEHYLLCAHPTLVYLLDKLNDRSILEHTLIAVDEFHHVSADVDQNRLGAVIKDLVNNTKAHVIAMTGSYFRGDSVPVLDQDIEDKFDQVSYTYYEQLNGYTYLKSLVINYAFYQGKWTDAIGKVLDLKKKTIIHIPKTNAAESTGDKNNEVFTILDLIGTTCFHSNNNGVYTVKTKDGRNLKVADLVNPEYQQKALNYLRKIQCKDDIDIIIAMNMAKEGFDWPWCEHAITVGYRNSLTEVVQIIGRTTRDCEGKSQAQFTNLIAKPDASQEEVGEGVSALLKAISLSLLMQQVLVPDVSFKTKIDHNDRNVQLIIDDKSYAKLSPRAKQQLDKGFSNVIEKLVNSNGRSVALASVTGSPSACDLVNIELEQILRQENPELNDQEIDLLTQAAFKVLQVKSKISQSVRQEKENELNHINKPRIENTLISDMQLSLNPNNSFDVEKIKRNYLIVDEFNINLIDRVNPFAGAYEFVSKSLDKKTLKMIQTTIYAKQMKLSMREVQCSWKLINRFMDDKKREPDPNADDFYEKRLGRALAYIRDKVAAYYAEGR